MLTNQQVSVHNEGELVVLRLGNVEIKMEYDTAIKLSTWLRVKGKKAKTLAGDTSRHWTIIGQLQEVEHS